MNASHDADIIRTYAARAAKVRRFDERMAEIAEDAAEELRNTDPYTDRTGDLRASTQAIPAIGGSESGVTLEMGEHYASYVNRRGFSRWDEVSKAAREEILAEAEDALEP